MCVKGLALVGGGGLVAGPGDQPGEWDVAGVFEMHSTQLYRRPHVEQVDLAALAQCGEPLGADGRDAHGDPLSSVGYLAEDLRHVR